MSEKVEDFDLSSYRAERDGVAQAAEPEQEESKTDAETADAEEVKESEEPAPETKEQDDEEVEQPKAKKKDRLQSRFDKLTGEIYELKAKLAEKETAKTVAVKTEGKPTLDSFDSLEEFQEALTDWKLDQRAAQAKQAENNKRATEQQKQVKERIDAAKTKYEDFEEVALDPDLTVSPAMFEAMMDSDLGADVLYFLGNHPEEASRISKLSPASAAREIGKIEVKLEAKPKAEPKVSKAPPPVKPLAGKAAPSFDPDRSSLSEYRRARESGKLR